MGIRTWLTGRKANQESGELEGKMCLPSARNFDPHTLVGRLDPELQFFADSFYFQFRKILPGQYILAPDQQAPEDVNCLGPYNPQHPFTGISLEYRLVRGAQSFKFGTGRVELRRNQFFAKTVTWKTPQNFLQQIEVYNLIKAYYQDSQIMNSKSRTGKGFAIKNKRHIITMEVFGNHGENGFLACDVTLNANNKPLACQRMEQFLEFYGCLYNLLKNEDLTYQVVARDPQEMNVEFVQDTTMEPEENRNLSKSQRFPTV